MNKPNGQLTFKNAGKNGSRGEKTMKMLFHYPRISESNITVDGADMVECAQKSFAERMKQVTPTKLQGEVVDDKTLVKPE